MFAIIGATGKVGGAVARTLLAAGHRIRVVARDPGKAAQWTRLGADLAFAETDQVDALTAAFAGVEGVFVMLPPIFDPAPDFAEARAMITALRIALERARAPRIVVLSTIGADAREPNLLSQLGLLEAALADLPAPVAFLRAAWFIENAAWDVADARDSGMVSSCLQPLDRPIAMVSAGDVGRLAAELLLEGWRGRRVVELEGPRRISPNDLAAAFAAALGRPVQAKALPRERWEALFRAQGMNNPQPRMRMIDGFNEGWIDFAAGGAQARKGETALEQAIAALVGKGSQLTAPAARSRRE
jgi:uncharacterized protein YbjT (DUF2867 family)